MGYILVLIYQEVINNEIKDKKRTAYNFYNNRAYVFCFNINNFYAV